MGWTMAAAVVVVVGVSWVWIEAVGLRWTLMTALVGKSTTLCHALVSSESQLISASRKRRDRSPSEDRRDPKRR